MKLKYGMKTMFVGQVIVSNFVFNYKAHLSVLHERPRVQNRYALSKMLQIQCL